MKSIAVVFLAFFLVLLALVSTPDPENTVPFQAPKTATVLKRKQEALKLYPPVVRITQASAPAVASPEEKTPTADHWNYQAHGLRSEDISPFIFENEPDSVVYYSGESTTTLFPQSIFSGYFSRTAENGKTVFIGTTEAIRKTAAERAQRAEENVRKGEEEKKDRAVAQESTPEITPPPEPAKVPHKLSENAYSIVAFRPGTRDGGGRLTPVTANLLASIQGPDYSLENFDPQNEVAMRDHLATILSLGHGGELILQVAGNGFIQDDGGFDFALYENAFRSDSKYSHEFGLVGVSNDLSPSTFKWFRCDPRNSVLTGCFGAVPTLEGGDQFDIADLGLKQIRYIWIKDLGMNKNKSSKWPTEGCDLDAMRLYHAYGY